MRRAFLAALLACYLMMLIDLTLLRFPQPGAPPNLVPLATISHYLRAGGREMWANVVGNIIAFAPLGLLLPALHQVWRSPLAVSTVSLAVSLLIESLQYLSGERVADVDDLLLNTLGGILGAIAFAAVRRIRSVPPLAQPAGS